MPNSPHGSSSEVDGAQPFGELEPDRILAAVESRGHITDGRLLALNSYENRVYQVGIEDGDPLIAKFYRPGRWSDAAILEEHQFCFDLLEADLPVVAPQCDGDGNSLSFFDDFRFSLYPRRGGRAPDFSQRGQLETMGRTLARMHVAGRRLAFNARPRLTTQSFGADSIQTVLADGIPPELREAYVSLTADLLPLIEQRFESLTPVYLRVHGDCHAGNILWRDETPNFVDFDDARMAPAVQDIWMLLSGEVHEQREQLDVILEAYAAFADFDYAELALIEPVRTLRMLHHAAWLTRRWQDPAFPQAFPWFNTARYWEDHILELREQFAALSHEGVDHEADW